MAKQHKAQALQPTTRVAADSRELSLGKIQAALLEQQASLEQTGGFDPYNCRQGSDRAEVWGRRRR